MKKPPMSVLAALGTAAVMALGGAAYATAASTPASSSGDAAIEQADPTEVSESAGDNRGSEGAADEAAQAAACKKAGVTGDNVDYDDETGVCSAEGPEDPND